MVDYERIVGKIYDCAANPELWSQALGEIRHAVGAAHVAAGFIGADASVAKWQRCDVDWDETWLGRLTSIVEPAQKGTSLHDIPLDVSWTRFMHMREEDFRETALYREWFKPQNLGDCLSVKYMQDGRLNGILAMPTAERHVGISSGSRQLAERISPHIRRAMTINNLTNHNDLTTSLFRQVLDRLSVAVFIIGTGKRLLFSNTSGEALLSGSSMLVTSRGEIHARRCFGNCLSFDDAIDFATKGDQGSAICVPLISEKGERAAAYVLPISNTEFGGAISGRRCVVFIAQRDEQQSVAVEILCMVHGLTHAEARVAYLLSRGDNPTMIAEILDVSVNTVRSHLKHAFSKTGVNDQVALGALVNGLMPPIENISKCHPNE